MVVDAVVIEGRSFRETAATYGVSKSWVYELVRRYRAHGPAGLSPASKRPHTNPRQMSLETEERIVRLRKELSDLGADCGAQTIAHHLQQRFDASPSPSAIYQLLKRRGFVTPEPRKRPRHSYVRFEADLPNECWQADMTHWQLRNGQGVEILNFIDDHSRMIVACEARVTVRAPDVRSIFERACDAWGVPASVLTDNGAIFNARSRQGRTGFESDLLDLGVLYKHSRPYHPETCGKIERWHQTLKQFLAKRPCDSIDELQLVLLDVVRYYNEVRPHRSRDRLTPRQAYDARAKAKAGSLLNEPHYRIRNDVVDNWGKVSLRYLGKMRHINVGYMHRGFPVRLYIVDDHIRVVTLEGEFLGELIINPAQGYQPIVRP